MRGFCYLVNFIHSTFTYKSLKRAGLTSFNVSGFHCPREGRACFYERYFSVQDADLCEIIPRITEHSMEAPTTSTWDYFKQPHRGADKFMVQELCKTISSITKQYMEILSASTIFFFPDRRYKWALVRYGKWISGWCSHKIPSFTSIIPKGQKGRKSGSY